MFLNFGSRPKNRADPLPNELLDIEVSLNTAHLITNALPV